MKHVQLTQNHSHRGVGWRQRVGVREELNWLVQHDMSRIWAKSVHVCQGEGVVRADVADLYTQYLYLQPLVQIYLIAEVISTNCAKISTIDNIYKKHTLTLAILFVYINLRLFAAV